MTVKTRESEKTEEKNSPFEIVRKAAEEYLSSGKPLYISAKDLCGSIVETSYMSRLEMETYNPEFHEGPVIVDLRSPDSEMPELYKQGRRDEGTEGRRDKGRHVWKARKHFETLLCGGRGSSWPRLSIA